MMRERGAAREAHGRGGVGVGGAWAKGREGEEQVKEGRQTADVAAASPRTELQE